MDEQTALSTYTQVFQAAARQLNSEQYAKEWMELEVPANRAAVLANEGYTPGEWDHYRQRHHARILTPEQKAEFEAQYPRSQS